MVHYSSERYGWGFAWAPCKDDMYQVEKCKDVILMVGVERATTQSDTVRTSNFEWVRFKRTILNCFKLSILVSNAPVFQI